MGGLMSSSIAITLSASFTGDSVSAIRLEKFKVKFAQSSKFNFWNLLTRTRLSELPSSGKYLLREQMTCKYLMGIEGRKRFAKSSNSKLSFSFICHLISHDQRAQSLQILLKQSISLSISWLMIFQFMQIIEINTRIYRINANSN